MRIIQLTAENVKKLSAVEIKPDGNMVQITGKNGQGKTSVLDAIWWAIAGTSNIQAQPIRKGEEKARIELQLGNAGKTELVVERRFTEKGSTLTVKNGDGFKAGSPQAMLDDLLGALTFDPLAFMRQGEKDQFNTLRSLVTLEIDPEALDKANAEDFTRRTGVNRDAKAKRAQAAAIQVASDLPVDRIDANALLNEMASASETNADVERRKLNRENAVREIENSKQQIDGSKATLPKLVDEIVTTAAATTKDLEAQIAALQSKINATAELSAQRIKTTRDAAEKLQNDYQAKILDTQAKLDAAPPLPDLIDIADLRQQIDAATAVNNQIDARNRRAEIEAEAEILETESKALTLAMTDREEKKREALSKIEMPVAGLSFGDGVVTFNGVPLNQASDAEQLIVSTSIAAALNPKLRVLRIRDGSLLDDEAMERLAKFADEQDMQIWVERVDSSGMVGIVMEDGHVKGQEPVMQAAE